jgi:prevent-host-death family protein
MIRLNVHEAKTHLSRYLERVEKGETIILCRHNNPIAEIRPIEQSVTSQRVFGMDKGIFEVGPEFFEPLPDDLLAYFTGERG